MPMKFSDLARSTKTGLLDLGDGDVIRFEFRHKLITPRLMHDFLALDESRISAASADEQEAAIMAVCEQVVRLVVEWDMQDDDGSMFPLTVERLRDFPLVTQIALLQQCLSEASTAGESSAPGVNGSANARPSGAQSSGTGNSARSRRGTR